VRPEGSVVLKRPAAVPLFSGLAPKAFELLVKELKAWEAEPGAVVVAEGEAGDSLFVVAKGRVRVERATASGQGDGVVVVGHVGEGGFFGEIAVVAQRPRAATVIAESTTELLEISRTTLDQLCAMDPRVREVLDSFCSERLKKSVLLSSPVFEGLSPALLARVSAGFEQQTAPAGEVLVTQGAPSGGLFVLLSGTVDVMARAEIGSVRLKQLQAGDVFGEMSLLSGDPASASVTASSPVRLLVLPAASFSSLSEEPELQARITALSSSRAAFNARFLPATDVARAGSV
jgi:cAMP-dependent protein kinase regulator